MEKIPYYRNINLIYGISFLKGLIFYLPILTLYLQQELVNVFYVTLILSTQALTTLVFEIPSGVFADVVGRKLTFILANSCSIISLLLLIAWSNLAIFLIYAFFAGLSSSLISGTDTAIIYDTLLISQQEDQFKKIIGITNSLWPLGAAIASFIGGFLALYSLILPIMATLIPVSLAFILTFFLVDPPFDKGPKTTMITHFKSSYNIVRKNRQIIILLTVGFLLYSFSETLHQLKPIFFKNRQISLSWFGILYTLIFAMSFSGAYLSQKISQRMGDKNTLLIAAISYPILVFLATYSVGLISGVLIAVGSFFWGMHWPISSHLINTEIDGKNRATINSVSSFFNSFGFVIFAPLFGWIVDLYDINLLYRISAIFHIISIVPLLFLKEKPADSC